MQYGAIQLVADSKVLVVVDLVEITGGAGVLHQLAGGGFLHYRGNFHPLGHVFPVNLVSHSEPLRIWRPLRLQGEATSLWGNAQERRAD